MPTLRNALAVQMEQLPEARLLSSQCPGRRLLHDVQGAQQDGAGQGEELELSLGLQVRGAGASAIYSQPGPDGSASVFLQPQHHGSAKSLLGPDGTQKGFWLTKSSS